MSTVASPRGSVTISSRRTSTSTDAAGSVITATTSNTTPTQRRNRAALRNYYGLPDGSASKTSLIPSNLDDGEAETKAEAETENENENERSPLDDPAFSPATYAANLLSTSTLQQIWTAQARLSSSIRSLDAEKKALVYDNYARLIAATDTIKRMRASFEPLAPATGELETEVARIAARASELQGLLRGNGRGGEGDEEKEKEKEEENGTKASGQQQRQRDTVRWVLDAPKRFEEMIKGGRRDAAETEWVLVRRLLSKWSGVGGVDEVRRKCVEIMGNEGGVAG